MDIYLNLFIAAIAVVALLLPTAFPNLSKLSSRLGMIGCVLVAFYAIYGAMVYVEPPTFRNPDGLYYYGNHPSAFFLSRSRDITNFSDPVNQLNPVFGETIIAPPSRVQELAEWARAHPGGELHYRYDCNTTMLLVYTVP